MDKRLKSEITQRELGDLAYTFSTLTVVHQALLPAMMCRQSHYVAPLL